VSKKKAMGRPYNPLKIFGRILSYVGKKYRWRLIVVFISIIVSAAANAIGISFSQRLIDDYIVPLLGKANPNFAPLAKAIGFMAMIYLCGAILTYVYNRTMVTVSQGMLKDIRDEMFAHMEILPVRYYDSNATGDIMSHFTNDTDTLRQMISQSIPQTIAALISVLSIVIAMFMINVPMTIFVLFMVTLMILVIRNLGSKSGKYFSLQQKALGTLNGYIEEMIEGQKVVKVFNHEEAAIDRFVELNEDLRVNSTKANTYANIMMPIMGNIGNFMYLLTAVVGAIFSITGVTALTLGSIVSFVQFTKSITMPIAQISQQFNAIILSLAGAQRIFELLDEVPETDEGHVELVNIVKHENGRMEESAKRTGYWAWKNTSATGQVQYTELKGDVRFEDVTFGYREDKTILHDINLFAKPGQKIAFVGATGAGKTTITNLINRFYDIQKGMITYDGINVQAMKKADLRRSLGIVLQDTHLFTGTIKDNIKYGNENITDEDVNKALDVAQATEFVSKLKGGVDYDISQGGTNVSGGQKQRLSIARAIAKNPDIYVFDDSFSALDFKTDAKLRGELAKITKDKTVLIVAQRISTIMNADKIVVLDEGNVVGIGTHKELMKNCDVYKEIALSQLSKEELENA